MILNPNPPADTFPAPWAVAFGEDTFGLWQAFEIKGARQVMRWILPGTFMMGFPSNEEGHGHYYNEAQYHATLTKGFWLGETTCTQMLWQAVMGENPSYFKDKPENPVEQVSWDDCQEFITTINSHLEGSIKLRLPTEAEWEYACRAGSTDPICWGDNLSTGLTFYNEDDSYAKGQMGKYRQSTLLKHSFEPNDWGLYQMHDSFLEWCSDWRGHYPTEAAVDPEGPAYGCWRVARGGSCSERDSAAPDQRDREVGLRLAGG